jgi:undecaprenyl pyrophosphate phosphatase UppP
MKDNSSGKHRSTESVCNSKFAAGFRKWGQFDNFDNNKFSFFLSFNGAIETNRENWETYHVSPRNDVSLLLIPVVVTFVVAIGILCFFMRCSKRKRQKVKHYCCTH